MAIKVLKNDSREELDETERFIREAAIAAKLEHPNIVPVYELDVDDRGTAYLCMRKIHGESLRAAIEKHKSGEQKLNLEEIVLIFLKLCDALSYAHHAGCIHQDIKPDNIMIGKYGEVFLIDWGASSYSSEEMSLTLAYMSPAQSVGDEPSGQDDIYCLGGTMFHLLFKRLPTVAKTTEDLWRKKQAGVVDEPTDEEAEGVPAALTAIVMKALAADPKDRYATTEELAEDLKCYQNGLAVSAYSDSLFEFLSRFYHRHRNLFWSCACVVILLSVFGGLFYHMKLKEIARWGTPIYVEDFSSESWKEKWLHIKGEFAADRERLVTVNGPKFMLACREKIFGDWAVEFDGCFLPGSFPGDLSVLFFEELNFEEPEKSSVNIFLQTGAWGNTLSLISHKNKVCDSKPFTLDVSKTYRIRAEKDGNVLRLLVDGDVITEGEMDFPSSSGYIGLYGYFPGKVFDNVTVYCKGVAEKVSVLETAEVFLKKEDYAAALDQYEEIRRSHHGKEVADEALFSKGMVAYLYHEKLMERNQSGEDQFKRESEHYQRLAFSSWRELVDHPRFGFDARLRLLQETWDNRKYLQLLEEITELAEQVETNDQLKKLYTYWAKATRELNYLHLYGMTNRFLDIREKYFTDFDNINFSLGWTYQSLERFEESEKLLHPFPSFMSYAYFRLGKPGKVFQSDAFDSMNRASVLLLCGRYQEVLDRFPELKSKCLEAQAGLGMFDYPGIADLSFTSNSLRKVWEVQGKLNEYCERFPDDEDALLRNGDEKLLLKNENSSGQYKTAMLKCGMYEEYLEKFPNDSFGCSIALYMLKEDERLLNNYPEAEQLCANVLRRRGEAEKVFERYPHFDAVIAESLYLEGKYKEVIDRFPYDKYNLAKSMVALQRFEDLAETVQLGLSIRALGLLYLGETEKARDLDRSNYDRVRQADYLDAFKILASGNSVQALDIFNRLGELPTYLTIKQESVFQPSFDMVYEPVFITPMVRFQFDENRQAVEERFRKAMQDNRWRHGQRLYYCMAYILGEVDRETFLEQPCIDELEGDLVLCEAIRAELNGENALAHYRRYQDLPQHKRAVNPVLDEFLRWKVKVLK